MFEGFRGVGLGVRVLFGKEALTAVVSCVIQTVGS